jgi:CBS domain-containing protein
MLPVKDKDGNLVGEVVERDLLKAIIDPKKMSSQELYMQRLLAMSYFPKSVKDIMRSVRLEVTPEDDAEFIARMMYKKETTLAAVIEDDKLAGIVLEDDLVSLMAKK